jgi:hypothetical protein
MRIRELLLALGLCASSSGCSFFGQAVRDLSCDALLPMQETPAEYHYKRPADTVLADTASTLASNDKPGGPDYARGFQDGFAACRCAGGIESLPRIAPWPYWAFKFQSPEGQQAIDQWFAGYRDGAASACESRQRQWLSAQAAPVAQRPSKAPRPPAGGLAPEASSPRGANPGGLAPSAAPRPAAAGPQLPPLAQTPPLPDRPALAEAPPLPAAPLMLPPVELSTSAPRALPATPIETEGPDDTAPAVYPVAGEIVAPPEPHR